MRRLVIASALLVGCSFVNDPDDHRPGGDRDPVPAPELCQEVAQVMCEGHLDCCSAPVMDLEGCVATVRRRCTERAGSILLDPRTGYDERVAAEVIDEGRGYAGACDTDIATWGLSRTGLLRVLRGTVEPGGECTPEGWLDFAASYSCNDLSQACVGAGGGRSFCVNLGREGDQCRANADCLDSLQCEGFMPFVSEGTCAPRLPNGETCDEATDCQSLFCQDAATCQPIDQDELFCALPNTFQ